jgi:maleylacetate reductase
MDPHADQPVVEAGVPLGQAPVVIMIHGRNAGPSNILDLVPRLARPAFTYLAPAAAGRTWYPQSFMAEISANEPYLTSALRAIESLVRRVEAAGIPRSRIVMLGFSQGACLAAEFAARHASRFGGLILLTGGVIGPSGTSWRAAGAFDGTPVFLGTGDPDSHVPVSRVQETAALFATARAAVSMRVYPGRPHTVSDDEIEAARVILDEVARVTIVSGSGSVARLPAELDARSFGRVVVVTTPGRARTSGDVRAVLHLGDRLVGTSETGTLHVPAQRVEAALGDVDRLRPDVLLAFGGGSAVGVAKAAARERSLPVVAVPTTYSGSEMTSIWGVSDGQAKRTGRDPQVSPVLVVYDAELTRSLAPAASAASGMNAIAHAVEALYASNADHLALAAADQAIRSLGRALPVVVADPGNIGAREIALLGAHLAGVALQHASMGLHHKICHVLGGAFGLPHAATHAAVLPSVVAFNAEAAPAAAARIAGALGVEDAADGLRSLNRRLGLTMSLRELGLRREDLGRAADLVAGANYPNPRPATVGDIRLLLEEAM